MGYVAWPLYLALDGMWWGGIVLLLASTISTGLDSHEFRVILFFVLFSENLSIDAEDVRFSFLRMQCGGCRYECAWLRLTLPRNQMVRLHRF